MANVGDDWFERALRALLRFVGFALLAMLVGLWKILHSLIATVALCVVVSSLILWWRFGPWAGAAVPVAAILGLVVWAAVCREPFKAFWWARWRFVTAYWPKWGRAMRSAKLGSTDSEHPLELPKPKALEASDYVDTLTAEMLPHQTVRHTWAPRAYGIGQTLGASGCRAVEHPGDVHKVDLWLWHDDPLKKMNPRPFPIPEPPADGNWYRWFQREMKYGIYENGMRAGIDLTQRMWLVVGKSRAGKSTSRVWPVVRMSLPMIKAKVLRYGVGDLKEGMELRAGRPIFEQNDGWYAQTLPELARALRGEVGRMLEQARKMGNDTDNAKSVADITRKLDWLTEDRPWTIIVIDELRSIWNASGHDDDRRSIIQSLQLIQQIGLSCGYSLIAGSQRAQKEVLGELRDDFTAVDCLAVDYLSETHTLFDKLDVEQYLITPHLLHIPEPEDPDQSGDQGIGWKRRPGYPRLRGTEVTNQDIWDMRLWFPGAWDRDEPAPTEQTETKPRPKLHLTSSM